LHDPAIISHLRSLNETRGIYFVVNSGGDKDDEIIRYNAFYAEYDDLSIDEQLRRFKSAPVLPSILNVTKKSVHVYWLLRGPCSEEKWGDGQERIISHFYSDPDIKNPARLMRLTSAKPTDLFG
jgi:putative DNA primase/helicase